MSNSPVTPLMKQYFEIKSKYPDSLVLFQVGDFYELFYEDARKAAQFLGITLTARGKHNGEPIPLCGVPVHTVNHYIAKLVHGGFRIALCTQLEEATPGKVVDRGVTQVYTPGTLIDSTLLDVKSASYLFSFFPLHNAFGLLFGELLTAQLFATVLPYEETSKSLESELIRFLPDEVIVPQTVLGRSFETYFSQRGYCTTFHSFEQDTPLKVDNWLDRQFSSADVHAVKELPALQSAVYNFYSYLHAMQHVALDQFKTFTLYRPEDFLLLDAATQRNLELVKNLHDGGRKNTLCELIDTAASPMGSRLIKKWLMRPLVNQQSIMERHTIVQIFFDHYGLCTALRKQLRRVDDVERVVGRIALGRASLTDYLHLRKALEALPDIVRLLEHIQSSRTIEVIRMSLTMHNSLLQILTKAMNDDTSTDYTIKKGFDESLDRLRDVLVSHSSLLSQFEQEEQRKTGINSLKVGFNQVHGYYIEITKSHIKSIPERYIRYQTLVGKERYTTLELKQLEALLYNAEMEACNLEKQIFEKIKIAVYGYISELRKTVHMLANLDALLAFAHNAYTHNYVRPSFNDQRHIDIVEGRHPVIEQKLHNLFIPNSTQLTNDQSVWIITGPNMGGKSTYLRQVALICLMAQCGSFVPAQSASLFVVDRIFTRIGSGDNVAEGKSTFLVEMEETAVLCSKATLQSLIILDEVGRGTSTFDGLAIAQAVIEYLHTVIQARCLFATHYHELALLPQQHKGIVSYHAVSKKNARGVTLLYKILPGIADGSFGIEVAKLAGIPDTIVARSEDILASLEIDAVKPVNRRNNETHECRISPEVHRKVQKYESIQHELENIDFDQCSPKKAFDILWKFREQL